MSDTGTVTFSSVSHAASGKSATRHVTDHAAEIARSAAFWANHKPESPYVPQSPLERLAAAQMDRYRQAETREENAPKTGESLTESPACFDMAPELAGHYRAIARAFEFERTSMQDDPIEEAITAEREAKAHEEMESLESLQSLRESTYVRHCRNRSGEVISEDAFARSSEGRAKLEDATLRIAMSLESVGRPALGTGPQAWIVDPISGQSRPIINVRKRAILPTVAAEKRAPVIAALEFLMRRRDHKHDLFCTFTSGVRVPLRVATEGAEVRAALAELHRRLSKLNGARFMKKAGARMVFRASEIGSLFDESRRANKNAEGDWTVHPHAHTLIHFRRFLPKKEMAKWAKDVWAFWGTHWHIDGAIEKIREACKYPFKPSEIDSLTPQEIGALDAALFRLHRVQPLGELREQIRARREVCLTIKRERRTRRGDGGERASELVPVVMNDWNARVKDRIPDPEKIWKAEERKNRHWHKRFKQTVGLILSALDAASGEQVTLESRHTLPTRRQAVRCAVAIADGRACLFPRVRTPRAVVKPTPWQNRIVARLSPAPYFDRVATPGLLVWSVSRPDISAIRAHPVVTPVMNAVGEQVLSARRALASGRVPEGAEVNVHTNPVTVPPLRRPPNATPHFPSLLKPQAWQQTEVFA
jgi:hypothetical protein